MDGAECDDNMRGTPYLIHPFISDHFVYCKELPLCRSPTLTVRFVRLMYAASLDSQCSDLFG